MSPVALAPVVTARLQHYLPIPGLDRPVSPEAEETRKRRLLAEAIGSKGVVEVVMRPVEPHVIFWHGISA